MSQRFEAGPGTAGPGGSRVWRGMAWYGEARLGFPSSARQVGVRQGRTCPGAAGRGLAWLPTAQLGRARRGGSRCGAAWYVTARLGLARYPYSGRGMKYL